MPERDPLVELLDEGRVEDHSATRSRERSLHRAAAEGATLAGLLVDLAERGAAVVVHTAAGRRHNGVLGVVAGDYCLMRCDRGPDLHVRLDAITTVRPHQGAHHDVPAGDRAPAADQLLVEVLGRLVDERPRVVLVTRGGEQIAGELRSVGADVVTLALDGGHNQLCFVSVAAITEALVDQ